MTSSKPTAPMRFFKYHALGNDYLVLFNKLFDRGYEDQANQLTQKLIRLICERNRGLGSDGILIGERSVEEPGFILRILNPDGSEADKSGNGLRIFARSLWDWHLVDETSFPIHTKGGTVKAKILKQGRQVEVEMGRVSFNSHYIPVKGPQREVLRESIELHEETLEFCAATIGNPHCVVLRKATPKQAKNWGPIIETHQLFPNRTNVQFLEVLDRESIRIEIWERGAGYTLASGSSSSVAAAVARKLGWCEQNLNVVMPGGTLSISVDQNYAVIMRGPVTRIGELSTDPELFEACQ